MAGIYIDPYPLPSLTVTSTVLKSSDGDIGFAKEAFLIPHEAVRLVTERTKRVLQFYNPEKCPWKIDRVRRWLTEYYIPIIHDHHDNEEEILFPYYKKLGVQNFEKQTEDHKILMKRLDDMKNMLNNANHTGDQLRTAFQDFADHMLEHLSEEETYWPPEFEKHGKVHYDKVLKLILAVGQKRGGIAFKMVLLEVCDAMGCNLNGPHPASGWAPKHIKDDFKASLPGFVRSLLVPGWQKTRTHYVKLFLSTVDDKETAVLKNTGGCQCTIA